MVYTGKSNTGGEYQPIKDIELEGSTLLDKQPQSQAQPSMTAKAESKSAESKQISKLKHSKLPSYASELLFVIVNMFLLKFYSERFFDAMTFFNISVPMLAYLICTLFVNLMEFIKLLHIEDNDSDSILSAKQFKLLTRVSRDLAAYFGIYYITAKLDQIITFKEDSLDNLRNETSFIIAVSFIEVSLLI